MSEEPVTIIHNSEPVQVVHVGDAPMYSDNHLKAAVDKARLDLNNQYRAVLEGKSHIAVHNVLCGCVSADCGIRLRVKFFLQPASMAEYLHIMLDDRMPDSALDRVFADLSPAECDRIREFLVKAEGA